ncbi:MAG TPA: cation transporter [Anaerolineales bacterium]|nr:cation transporter [Anaerolineales bacterium]
MYLLEGPLTMEQINTCYNQAPFPLSRRPTFYTRSQWNVRGLERLPKDMAALLEAGWIIQEGDQYALTDHGRQLVNQAMAEARKSTDRVKEKLRPLLQPEVASKVTLIVQIILALIKLPAGILSGSIGLLNDAADTLLDLFSSLLVYFGIRFNRERFVSILLVVFMLGTGGFTLYEAAQRVMVPYVPKVDWFPFAAAILSALAGLLLWTYQRYVGIHSALMAFIAESVDSRNHVIVALSVTAGLVAALLRIGLLDMLVGLVVAILILWSALQLALDLLKSSTTEQVNLSHYGFWLLNVYEYLRDAHLKEWMLYLIDRREVKAESDVIDRVHEAFDFRNNQWMKMVGLDRQFATETQIAQILNELFSQGWVIDREPLSLSKAGKEYLRKQGQHHRRRGALTAIDERDIFRGRQK